MGRRSRKRGPGRGAEAPSKRSAASATGSTRAERDAARERRARALAEGEEAPPTKPRASGRRARNEDRPAPPWGSFPLTELTGALAVLLLIGSFFAGGARGPTMFIAAMVLGSLVGVELSLREHLTGFRSHTTLLAGVPGVVVMIAGGYLLGVSGVPGALTVSLGILAGAATFGLFFVVLRRTFRRRSGGLSVRF